MKLFAVFFLFIHIHAYANECAGDAKKFCRNVDPGKGQLAKCLEDYSGQLSTECSRELKNFKLKTAKKNPCFEDLADLCVDIPAEARNLEYCLLKNESKLSDVCVNDFKKKKGNLIVRDVCAQDIVNNCYSDLSGPDGSINRCLIRNRSKLSTNCQMSVDKKIATLKKKNPCFDETEKFCPRHVRFAEIQECLERKIPSLSANCKKVVEHDQAKAKKNPCYRDLTRHCKMGLSPKEQHECLTLNEKELSRGCLDFRKNEDKKVKNMVESCEQDRLRFCSEAPFQNGMVTKCLKKNKAKVTKQCADLL